jgi:hypothetical protein
MGSAGGPGGSGADEEELLVVRSFHTTAAMTRSTRRVLFNRDIMRDKQTIRIR